MRHSRNVLFQALRSKLKWMLKCRLKLHVAQACDRDFHGCPSPIWIPGWPMHVPHDPPPSVRTGSWEGHTMPTMVILVLCKGLRIWFSDWQKLEELSSGLQRHSGRPHKTGLLWCQVPRFLLWVFSLLLLFGPWDFLLFGAQLCVQKNRIDPSSLPEPPRSEPVSYHIPF